MILGDLVTSKAFKGVGKILGINNKKYQISFFYSPMDSHAGVIEIDMDLIRKYKLYSEQVVYFFDKKTNLWRRARYIGPFNENKHLLFFRKEERELSELAEIFVLNTQNEWVDPSQFLKTFSNDAPYYYPLRENFIKAYIRQRAACCSIGAILSSSIELEVHQLAVVKRVLQDPIKKYLLADEVGLGKTIEAGILIREHILHFKKQAQVLIVVPDQLLSQWKDELCKRFHLSELLSSDVNDPPNIQILAYSDFYNSISKTNLSVKTMVVIDEMHQLATWAWDDDPKKQFAFDHLVQNCKYADTVLLLSGTPLNGNEKNFLAMLHCLSPQHYPLDEKGIADFQKKIAQSESLGGMRGALVSDNDNSAIEYILDDLNRHFAEDTQLQQMIADLRPLVDLFDGVDQDNIERKQKIDLLNHYIGDHYRLHERMLRNRRDVKGLNILFPGLAGAEQYQWRISQGNLSLETLMIEYLRDYHRDSETEYLAWFADFMLSPELIAQRCTALMVKVSSTEQQQLLREIQQQAVLEQQAKDQLLLKIIGRALAQSEKLKVVIFVDAPTLSEQVYEHLAQVYPNSVLHNRHDELMVFNDQESTSRIMVCDNQAEDGLNLQGVERLVIHYAISMSISRIEQRLGRVNRYCANLKGVQPVQSWLLVPEYEGIFNSWVDILDNSLGIFNRTIASLQYVLEEQFTATWRRSMYEGSSAFSHLKQRLGVFQFVTLEDDPVGLIAQEFQKVRAQEELMRMDNQVHQAIHFAEAIHDSDEQAEKDAQYLLDWMISGLQFKKRKEGFNSFRLGYKNGIEKNEGRTLLDIKNFLTHCLLGIDYDNPPWTYLMSPSRQFISSDQGNIYPLRYGQPFVDSIFNLLKQDARGASCAILRVFKKITLPDPQVFFRSTWLIEGSNQNAVSADEQYSPHVVSIWIDMEGSVITDADKFHQLLVLPYKHQSGVKIYEEINLRAEIWSVLQQKMDLSQWSNWIDRSVKKAENILKNQIQAEVQFTLVGLQAQIYLSA